MTTGIVVLFIAKQIGLVDFPGFSFSIFWKVSYLSFFIYIVLDFFSLSAVCSTCVLLGIENCMYTPLVQIQRDEIYESQVTFSMKKIYLHIYIFFRYGLYHLFS